MACDIRTFLGNATIGTLKVAAVLTFGLIENKRADSCVDSCAKAAVAANREDSAT
jgi:hypothetical protein